MLSLLPATITTHCAKCSRELTDAASVEAGIGPVCRQKANAILAKEIPAAFDQDMLWGAFTLSEDVFAEHLRPVAKETIAALHKSRAFNRNEGGEDNRSLVRSLAFLMSGTTCAGVRGHLRDAIRGLGFLSYAAYLDGSGNSTPGAIEWRGDVLFFDGARNLHALHLLCRARGVKRNYTTGEWVASLAGARTLLDAVRLYWPLTDTTEAERLFEEKSAVWRIESTPSDYLRVLCPYNPAFIQGVKALPANDRKWDGAAWLVRQGHRSTIEALLTDCFPLAA